MQWRPSPGQVVLLEPVGVSDALTGVVQPHADRILVGLGDPAHQLPGNCEVRVSVFTPEALYRMDAVAVAVPGSTGLVELDVRECERIQRRATGRARLALRVALAALDGGFGVVAGVTVDLGPGGCRVRTPEPFPEGEDPTLTIELEDGTAVMARGRVLEHHGVDGGHEYRLAFIELDDDAADRLKALVDEGAAPVGP